MTSALDINLYDPERYVAGVPHDAFAYLRRHAPVYRHPEPTGDGFWAVTRYHDVVAVSRDSETFSSERGLAMLYDYPPEEADLQRMMMLNQDPPHHTRLRGLVNRGFTPRMVATLEERVKSFCVELVDELLERGTSDFVRVAAGPLPLMVIAHLLGAPQEDHEKIFDWSNKMIGFDDPEFQTTLEDGKEAAFELFEYANALGARRRAEPADDICTKLVQPDVNGDILTELEFDMFFVLLSVAGNETTRNTTSGGLLALIEHPEQWQRLRADRSLLPKAVDEIVRWVSAVMQFRRTATKPTRIGEQDIAEGDKIIVFYPSANRDETVFTDPNVFDIGRDPNPHIGFGGGGAHFCLGSHVAKLSLRCFFGELLDRVAEVELAGPVRRLRSNFINGIKEMQVRVVPA